MVMYMDAAYEPNSETPAGMGACVFDPTAPQGMQWVVASREVEEDILARWRERKQYTSSI
jgi:hypothetical protein